MKYLLLLILSFFFLHNIMAQSEWNLRLMPQPAFGARNTVQIPNEKGTRLSLDKDLNRKNDVLFSPRIELQYNYKRHYIIATASLLNDSFEGITGEDILYNNLLFNAGSLIEAKYRFNTYRIGYRYRLVDNPGFVFDIGATLLLRDAYISLEDNTKKTKYDNVGIAPLLSYNLEWNAIDNFSLLTYGDAFAVKAGRAIDIFAGGKYRFTPLISALAGYRILDGGSDSDDVYTMATFHFISVGIGLDF